MMIPPANLAMQSRRGTVYVLVLGISLLVLTISLGSVAVVRAQLQNSRDDADASDAAAYAQSAIEIGRQMIAADANWRTTQSNGVWINNRAIGSGSFTLNVVNPNGPLNNSANDPVIMTGTGIKNHARHVMQVTLNAVPQPLTCLQAALCAGNHLTCTSATVQHLGLVVTNRNFSATSSLIVGDVEASGTISGGTYAGKRTAAVPLRTMPDVNTVQNHYVANGTTINFNTIPKLSGVATIDRRLFSPANNPFMLGALNPQGIYIIDCGGSQIIIQNTRILGTLVILNAGANSVMQGAMIASPAVANYPTLIVKGDFRIATSGTLSEAGPPDINFNPPGSPYKGVSNSTSTDTYASELQGLYYISGTLTLSNGPAFSGVVVSGNAANISGTLTLSHDATFSSNPPPGFLFPPIMTPLPGSWTRVVN